MEHRYKDIVDALYSPADNWKFEIICGCTRMKSPSQLSSTNRMITMHDGVQVAQQAARDIETWLRTLGETISVQNVEDHPDLQRVDVDLIWTTQKGSYKMDSVRSSP